MQRVNKQTVKSRIRKSGYWKGYLAPCKVALNHVVNGWGLGLNIEVTSIDELDKLVAAFEYYNCNYELGYYTAYWEV